MIYDINAMTTIRPSTSRGNIGSSLSLPRSIRCALVALVFLLLHRETKILQRFAASETAAAATAQNGSRTTAKQSAGAAADGDGGGSIGSQPQTQGHESERCAPPRDVSDMPASRVRYPAADESLGRQNSKYEACLRFECDWTDHDRCDAMTGPTTYDDPSGRPPCCVHILRDMARAFDDAMCSLGLEYFAMYGTLLGLVRNDRLIPWTSDNDYVATERTVAAMYEPDAKEAFERRGLAFFFDNFYHRVCATPQFMGGALAANWTKRSWEWYPMVHPYADVFVAREEEVNRTTTVVDELGCAHPADDLRPAQRRGAYGNAFRVSAPRNAERVLERLYGTEWRVPDAKKSPHGDTRCKKRP